ncbi:SRPBCC family protein [Polaribacter porphyrae]|uniref:1,4-dihydroxy-2-naphthoate prenyltransferase n=1 Tax=Polaribacter porphyrae TaxID=1137780 RepID=A0A2S7WTH6_9FLAO|nr:SRPBCC family protein [Polaribacter porphyrae]PQJ80897.1 1,4-dihydroxy-2-naphthoate prenyltransferase [Polaribacter porphyrae]
MRKIKIILGIITALSIVFFATGLFVKETNYTTEVVVNKSLNKVFQEFNNQENAKKWIPEIEKIETINKNIGITGSEYKIILENKGEKITMTEKVMAYVPNEKVTLFYDAENMLKTNDYLFSEENGKTKIILNATCRSHSYIMSCLFPYFKGTFKTQDTQYLTNFKEFVEQQ